MNSQKKLWICIAISFAINAIISAILGAAQVRKSNNELDLVLIALFCFFETMLGGLFIFLIIKIKQSTGKGFERRERITVAIMMFLFLSSIYFFEVGSVYDNKIIAFIAAILFITSLVTGIFSPKKE